MDVMEKIFAPPRNQTPDNPTLSLIIFPACSCPQKQILTSPYFGEFLCVQVWDCNATEIDLSTSYSGRSVLTVGWRENGEEEAATLAPTVIADATTENIQKAKEFINRLTTIGCMLYRDSVVDWPVLLIGHCCNETSLSNY